ncbi:MAG: GIY-YIG nuclease family protein [Candidatus Odinarchaeota archaeon]
MNQSLRLILNNVWGIYYGVIYKLIDTSNSKVYIGQTVQSLKKRFYQHLYSPVNEFLTEAFDKYPYKLKIQKLLSSKTKLETRNGEFIIEVIQYCMNVDELNNAEIEQIKRYKSYIFESGNHIIKNGKVIPLYGYNSDKGGGSYIRSHTIIVDRKNLKNLLSQGLALPEIANEFQTSTKTIRLRIREFWKCDTYEVRKKFGSLNKHLIQQKQFIKDGLRMMRIEKNYLSFDKDFISNLIEDELSPKDIEKEFFKTLFYKGYNSKMIGNITKTYSSNYFKELFGDNFDNLRDVYFYKIRIIELIQQNKSLNEIYEHFKINFSNKRGMGWRSILAAIKRIWSSWFYQLGHITTLFLFLERIYRIFPKINNPLLISLLNSNCPPHEIDKQFLIYLLHQNYSKEQIANSFNLSITKMGRHFHNIFSMNYRKAKREYYYKPHIIELIENGFILTIMVNFLPFITNYQHLQRLIELIWKEEIPLKLSTKSIYNYILKKYKKTNFTIDNQLIKYLNSIFNVMRKNGNRFFDNQIIGKIMGYDYYSLSRYIKNKLIPYGLVSLHHKSKNNKDYFILTQKGLELAKKLNHN